MDNINSHRWIPYTSIDLYFEIQYTSIDITLLHWGRVLFQKVYWSEGSLFRRVIGPRGLWSENIPQFSKQYFPNYAIIMIILEKIGTQNSMTYQIKWNIMLYSNTIITI